MNFLRKYIFLFISCVCIFACRDSFGEQRNEAPKKSDVPLINPSSSKKSSNKEENQNDTQTPVQKEVKKEKNTAIDTLKPVKALP